MLALTYLTFGASPTVVPVDREVRFFRICLTRSLWIGVLPLVYACGQLRRGLVVRPVVAGALAGLATGLGSDAGIRLYCEVSDPAHVLTAHAAGIIALAGIGMIAGLLLSGRPRHQAHAGATEARE